MRSVATFLRAPWCSSMLITFLLGCEKQTDRWDMSLTNLPFGSLDLIVVHNGVLGAIHTSRTLHGNYSRFDVDFDCSTISGDLDSTSRTARSTLAQQRRARHSHHFQGLSTTLLSVCTSSWQSMGRCHRVVVWISELRRIRGAEDCAPRKDAGDSRD